MTTTQISKLLQLTHDEEAFLCLIDLYQDLFGSRQVAVVEARIEAERRGLDIAGLLARVRGC